MRFLHKIILSIIIINFVIFIINNILNFEDKTELKDFLREVRCLTCPGQSIAESNSNSSQILRSKIEEYFAQGKTVKQIKNILISQYGANILFSTPKNYHTFFLWQLPFFCIITGFYIIRKYT